MTEAGPTQRPARVRLLGRYPVPTLRLVGAGLPLGPRTPSRWQSRPLPQHGIDYTIAGRRGLTPVRWRPELGITVRLTRWAADSPPAVRGAADVIGAAPDTAEALERVVGELRALTGLELRVGQPLSRPIDLGRVPDQEIHVAYLPSAAVQEARGRGGDGIASGGALPAPDSAWYRRGWAIVDTDLAIGSASPPGEQSAGGPTALEATGLALLRHQLCHALGLGHAARRRVLMHPRIPLDLDGYSDGDRHGLALLGSTRPVPHDAPSAPPHERTVPCR